MAGGERSQCASYLSARGARPVWSKPSNNVVENNCRRDTLVWRSSSKRHQKCFKNFFGTLWLETPVQSDTKNLTLGCHPVPKL